MAGLVSREWAYRRAGGLTFEAIGGSGSCRLTLEGGAQFPGSGLTIEVVRDGRAMGVV